MVGKGGSGRTAAVLDLNWDRPTLSVVHALDQRNTIQPSDFTCGCQDHVYLECDVGQRWE